MEPAPLQSAIAAERTRMAALEHDDLSSVAFESIAVVAGIGDRLHR